MSKKTIAVLGTLDTKALEHLYLAEKIKAAGFETLIIDVGSEIEAHDKADISVGVSLANIHKKRDRGLSVQASGEAAAKVVKELYDEGKIQAIISAGGGGGTSIACTAMRELPIGLPKLMVSTMASGNTEHYVGVSDIVMFPSMVDVSGLNSISRRVYSQAAAAICGMLSCAVEKHEDKKPVIVASMFGNTTLCIEHCRELLEAEGYELIVLHATGTGGRVMENLIQSGFADAVLDITTTEIADEVVGGVLSAGPSRLEAAGLAGLPTVVSAGCLDMVNFGIANSIDDKFSGRNFYEHNPQVTLMRTNKEEAVAMAKFIAEKLNRYQGKVTFCMPTKGLSMISVEGEVFHDPEADKVLFDTLKEELNDSVELIEVAAAVNDEIFTKAAVRALLGNIHQNK